MLLNKCCFFKPNKKYYDNRRHHHPKKMKTKKLQILHSSTCFMGQNHTTCLWACFQTIFIVLNRAQWTNWCKPTSEQIGTNLYHWWWALWLLHIMHITGVAEIRTNKQLCRFILVQMQTMQIGNSQPDLKARKWIIKISIWVHICVKYLAGKTLCTQKGRVVP